MHSTPSGTPLASPREGNTPPAGTGGDADLEAPLLGRRAPKRLPARGGGSVLQATVFGLINTAAGVPALIAFCAVVFKDPLYRPFLDPLWCAPWGCPGAAALVVAPVQWCLVAAARLQPRVARCILAWCSCLRVPLQQQ